jgi:hypothetical protein
MVVAIGAVIRFRRFLVDRGGGMVLLLTLGACVPGGLWGCASVSPLAPAATVANAAAELGATAEPLLDTHCEKPMVALAERVEQAITEAKAKKIVAAASQLQAQIEDAERAGRRVDELLEQAVKLAAICDPLVLAYDVLRAAHIALRAGIVVAAASGDYSKLGPLIGELASAATVIAADVERMRKGGSR